MQHSNRRFFRSIFAGYVARCRVDSWEGHQMHRLTWKLQKARWWKNPDALLLLFSIVAMIALIFWPRHEAEGVERCIMIYRQGNATFEANGTWHKTAAGIPVCETTRKWK